MITDFKKTIDFWQLTANNLSHEFAQTANERDAMGGTPTHELDRLRNSDLLNILISKEHGGSGETWSNAFKVVREIAKADGSLGQLLGYHYVNSTIPHMTWQVSIFMHYQNNVVSLK